MKKLTLLVMVLFSVNAFGASAVSRNGENIDQYNISDPGNVSGFDNYRVYYSHGIAEVVIQISGINTRTISESYYCQEDVDIVECPDDDIGGGVLRSPVLMFLEEIFSQNGVTQGAPITGASERMIYLAFWHEYRTKKLVTDSIAEMVLRAKRHIWQLKGLFFRFFLFLFWDFWLLDLGFSFLFIFSYLF